MPTSRDPLPEVDFDRAAQMLGARRTITVEGVEWKASPITLLDYIEYTAWLRGYIREEHERIRQAAEGIATEVQLLELRAQAVNAIRHPLASPFARDPLPQLEFARIAFAPNHPGVTREQVARILTAAGQQQTIIEQIARLNRLDRGIRVRMRAERILNDGGSDPEEDDAARAEFWRTLLQSLAEAFNWAPETIAHIPMNSVQLWAAKGDPGAITDASPELEAAFVKANSQEPD